MGGAADAGDQSWGEGPKYLICDNASVFGEAFARAGAGTEVIHIPPHTPQANGYCERLMGSIKHECLAHMLIFHEQQLRRVMKKYATYYETARPHQGIDQQMPAYFDEKSVFKKREKGGKLLVTPILNGLHHSYSWAALPA